MIDTDGGKCTNEIKCGRWICTYQHPYPGRPEGVDRYPATHVFAREVPDSQRNGWPSGDTVEMKCPVCNTTWTEELPQ